MRRSPFSLILAASLLPAVVCAETPAPQPLVPDEAMRRAEELAREGMDKLLRALETLRDAVPQYGVPYMDPDGNIVIPRLPPGETTGQGGKPLRS
jgi:hypothetical protein